MLFHREDTKNAKRFFIFAEEEKILRDLHSFAVQNYDGLHR